MSGTVESTRIRRILITETKTVAQLLEELELSTDHVVLLDGKRVSPDTEIRKDDRVVVLPILEGG